MPSVSYELEIEKHELIVNLDCNVISCNDGIGSYEYMGHREYDAGEDYADIDEITWDKSEYTDKENEIIQEEVNKQWDRIVEKALKDFDPY